MKPIYLYEIGIRPWEQLTSVEDNNYATITIVQRSIEEISSLFFKIVADVKTRLPEIVNWRTIGHVVENSKVQEHKLLKQLMGEVGSNGYIEKNQKTGIYSYVKDVSESIITFNLNSITQSRYSMLLFVSNQRIDLKRIWDCMKSADQGINAEEIRRIIFSLDNLMLCRVVESDTHVVIQFMGVMEQVDHLLALLCELDINRVSEQQALSFINKATTGTGAH